MTTLTHSASMHAGSAGHSSSFSWQSYVMPAMFANNAVMAAVGCAPKYFTTKRPPQRLGESLT